MGYNPSTHEIICLSDIAIYRVPDIQSPFISHSYMAVSSGETGEFVSRTSAIVEFHWVIS
jgi:hypothetical protein